MGRREKSDKRCQSRLILHGSRCVHYSPFEGGLGDVPLGGAVVKELEEYKPCFTTTQN
jgi:hypothetical protein